MSCVMFIIVFHFMIVLMCESSRRVPCRPVQNERFIYVCGHEVSGMTCMQCTSLFVWCFIFVPVSVPFHSMPRVWGKQRRTFCFLTVDLLLLLLAAATLNFESILSSPPSETGFTHTQTKDVLISSSTVTTVHEMFHH